MKPRFLIMLTLVVMLALFAAAPCTVQAQDKATVHEQPVGEGGGMDLASYSAFDNPNYYYAAVKVAPSGTYYRQAGLSPNGTKIVAQKSWNDGTYNRTEIVLMDVDGTDETVISAGDSGTGDIYGYMNPFWSDDGTAIGYAEVHNANPNKIVRYDLAGSTHTYVYEPAAPLDVNNADFLGASTSAIVFWAYGAGGSVADLFTWDGTTLTNITNSADYKEYEPVSNADGTVIVYWSGETTAEPVNTTHTLTYSGGTWTKDVGFSPISDSYWSGWSGRADNYIATTVMSSKDIAIYDSSGTFVTDLTGTGYSGGSGQWNFFGVLAEGPNGNWVITSNAARVDAGRDIVCAASRLHMYVAPPPLGSDANCGTEAAPFATIQKGVDEVVSGGTVHVAAGTYTENINVNKRVTIIGAGSGTDGTVVTGGGGGAGGVVQLSASGLSAAQPILLQALRIQPTGKAGISVGLFTQATGTNVSYVELNDVKVVGTNTNPCTEQERGLYVDLTSSLTYLKITNSAFDNLHYGWYFQKHVSADTSTVQYVDVQNTTFNHNNAKGIYAEKLEDATFTGITVDQNGYDASQFGACDYFKPWLSGIDVNLKAGTYQNLSFVNPTITSNGLGGAKEGVGIGLKARDDGASYGAFPATLNNVSITGGTVSGNERGIRFGEPGKNNAGPTGVSVSNVCISGNVKTYPGTDGSAYGGLVNQSLAADVAENNWWGSASGPANASNPGGTGDAVFGNVDFVPWLNACGGVSTGPVYCNTPPGWYLTIQAGVDGCDAGGTVSVAAGTYIEYVTINKDLTLTGAPGATIQKPAGDVYYKLPDEGTTKSFRPIVLAYGGSITGGDGTSAATAFTIQGTGTVDVTISGFAVKANNAWTGATSSNFADAILLRNVVGTVSSNTIDDMLPSDTNQFTLGIEVRGDNSNVTISGNTVTEYGRVGILVAGNVGTPVATVSGNTVTAVYFGSYVTNGIEINYRSTGTVSNNTVTGASGAGTIWSGACIMLTDADNVTISQNNVSDCEIGIAVGGRLNLGYVALNNVIEGNILDSCLYSAIEIDTNSQNTTIRNNTITGVAARVGTEEAGIVVLEYSNPASGYPNGVLIEGNSISGDPGFWGIDIYRNADNVTIQNNTITGGAVGVALELKEANSVGKTITIGGATGKANSFTGQTVLAVSTGPYDYSGVIYQWTPDVNASANWWGTSTPADVAAIVSANVDYTPWLAVGTDTSTDPGFQGDFSTLWVDDNCPQTGTTGRIQEAVDMVSGSTVYVAAGLYHETVNVEGHTDLTIQGEDRDTTIIQPTTTLPWNVGTYGSSRLTTFRVVNSTNFTLQNVTIDCDLVKANFLWATLFWDSTGTLNNNIIENNWLLDTAGGYYEFGSAFRAPGFTDGSRANITLSNNIYKDTGRVGIHAHDYVHLTITDNKIYKTTDDFGYGMEIGSQSTAAISGNEIYGYDTPAASDGSGSAGIYIENAFTSGIVSPGVTKNVSLTGNEIYGCQAAVHIGNEFNGYAGNVDIVVTATDNDLHDNVDAAVYIADEDKAAGSSVTYTGSGNTLADNGVVGYFIYTSGDGDITVSLDRETISGHEVGIYLNDYDATPPTGSSYDVEVHNSSIVDNTVYGVQNDYSGTTIDATLNWWGDPCGPVGAANHVLGNVDYNPWWANAAMTTPGPIAGSTQTIPAGATTAEAQAILDCAGPGSTVTFQSGSYPGGLFVNNSQLTLQLNSCTVGGPAPAFTIVGDDEVIQGPGAIDGGGGGGAGILVQAGADNFILNGVQVTGWANGVELAGDVTSFKIVSNWIHSNTGHGLLVDADVDLGGVVTIEGNLFKVNGGNGIQHNGNGTLPAEYNSWGDIGGYATGDGIGGLVDADPFTYVESFFDVWPDALAIERHVPEGTSFDVALKADAVNVGAISFGFTYDPAVLTLNSATFASPWVMGSSFCVDLSTTGNVKYVCALLGSEWTATAGTIATFNFTAPTLSDDDPVTTYLDLSHLEADTSAAAIGGQKVFVNNAGFNLPSSTARDITDTDDGRIIIERLANYTGLVDLQGRVNDSGATVEVHATSIFASTLLAQATSTSSGAFTTAYVAGNWLGIGSTYWFQVDRALYLPTTVLSPAPAANYAHSKALTSPLTALGKVLLLGGDANNNDRIDVGDLSCIGGAYGTPGGACAGGGSSDVNGDGGVNVQDLSMAGGNLYKTSSPWTP